MIVMIFGKKEGYKFGKGHGQAFDLLVFVYISTWVSCDNNFIKFMNM